MRLFCTSIAVCTALLLTGCTYEPASAPISATPSPQPTPLSEQQRLDQQMRTAVNVYGQLVCDRLAEQPDAKISALVDTFVSKYAPAGTPEEDRLSTARRLLVDAVAKYCPDQAARVAKGIAAG
jgi:hypothetical protein